MIKKLGLAFTLLAIAVSCSTQPKKPTAWRPTPVKAGDRHPTSMAHYSAPSDPITIQTIREIDAALIVDRTETMKQKVDARLSQILNRTAIGYDLMQKFDADLDKAIAANPGTEFDLSQNKNYLKLQLARHAIDEVEQRMADVYAHLWKVALGIDGIFKNMPTHRVMATRQRAREMVEYVHSRVNEIGADARVIALIRSKAKYMDIATALQTDIPAEGSTNEMPGQLRSAYENLIYLVNVLNAREVDAQTIDNTLFMKIVTIANDVGMANLLNQVDRLPQSVLKKSRSPQATWANYTGRSFPANKWVLTFDDGPHASHTMGIANALKAQGVKGEYFWLSKLVPGNAAIVSKIVAAGHGINSHSKNHADLTKLSKANVTDQVVGSKDIITRVVRENGDANYTMKNFRCPYGACYAPKSSLVQGIIADAGLNHIYWTVDSLDWQDKNTTSVYNRVLKEMKAAGRGIVLFHDIHPRAENVLPLLFKSDYVKSNGVQFVKLSEVL